MANTLAPAPINHVMNGSAKVWNNMNGTGTISNRDSFNVSSLQDLGTGRYKININNNMNNANYSGGVSGNPDEDGVQVTTAQFEYYNSATNPLLAGSYRIRMMSTGDGGSGQDHANVFSQAHGDLA